MQVKILLFSVKKLLTEKEGNTWSCLFSIRQSFKALKGDGNIESK